MTGVELAAGAARVVVARAESGRLRVIGRAETAVPRDAIVGGLVVDPPAVSDALGAAVAAAERGTASDRAVIAIDGDDVRTYHVSTPFEREASAAPITRAEIDRALREARDDAARHAQTEVDDGNAASIALLQSWLEQDATDDPEELCRAQEELDEFKRAINAERERAGARQIYP